MSATDNSSGGQAVGTLLASPVWTPYPALLFRIPNNEIINPERFIRNVVNERTDGRSARGQSLSRKSHALCLPALLYSLSGTSIRTHLPAPLYPALVTHSFVFR